MSLASYIIDREELYNIIQTVISESSIKADLVGIQAPEATIDVNLDSFDGNIEEIDSLISYQSSTFNDIYGIVNSILSKYVTFTSDREKYIYDITKLIINIGNERKKTKEILEKLASKENIDNNLFKVRGYSREIPDSDGKFFISVPFSRECLIKSITVYQTDYNYNDYWDFTVDNKKIMSNISSKYSIDTKRINGQLKVDSTTTNNIVFYNMSKKKKTIYYDINYLELN
ncbi:hypothetical protein Bp8pS_132 [Bacillus phage vB_BpuM-BpSp]|nr:hypothetical protein Bp8pS_132 [Bacillus phage vB_BpuM-BpSp]